MEEGDTLLLCTDGVIEARRNGEMFGQERLEDLLREGEVPVEELPSALLDRVLDFAAGTLSDDAAIVAVSIVDTRYSVSSANDTSQA